MAALWTCAGSFLYDRWTEIWNNIAGAGVAAVGERLSVLLGSLSNEKSA